MVAAVFLLNIYTNMMALKGTTVETVIVFRSLTTVIVAMCDWRGQPVGTRASDVADKGSRVWCRRGVHS